MLDQPYIPGVDEVYNIILFVYCEIWFANIFVEYLHLCSWEILEFLLISDFMQEI